MILEDELQRIKLLPRKDKDGSFLNNSFRIANLPTGVVCGVYGEEVAGGKFEVDDIIFPTACVENRNNTISNKDDTLILMSGLGLGSDEDPMPLELAISWLVGEAGEMSDQEQNSKVERVIIAGNSLAETMRDRDAMSKAKYLTKDRDASSLAAICRLDDILVQLASSVDVDLMPGPNDPTNQLMPQQPLHHCLFPRKCCFVLLFYAYSFIVLYAPSGIIVLQFEYICL